MNSHHESRATASEKEAANADATITEKLRDALTPGYQAEFDPDEAMRAGAFAEDALSEQDAAESGIDLLDAEASDDVPVQGRQGLPVAPSDDA